MQVIKSTIRICTRACIFFIICQNNSEIKFEENPNLDTLKEEKTMFKILTDLERHYPILYYNGVRRGKILVEFLKYAGIEEKFSMSIALAARVSDIGMIYLDSKLLKKIEKGIVNYDEQEEIEKSNKKGVDYLVKNLGTNFPDLSLESILYQYERYDGTGRGMKKGSEIPGPAYIVALAREFDKNIKKQKMSCIEAINEIEKDTGKIDPYWIELFKKFIQRKENQEKIREIYNK